MKALIVDDQRSLRELVRNTLEKSGISGLEVLEAADGIEALQLIEKEHIAFDLFLIDWTLPHLDGITLIHRIRAMDAYRTTPILMVTASADAEHVSEASAAGADEYIVKPFTSETLRERVRKHLPKAGPKDRPAPARPAPEGIESVPLLQALPPSLRDEIRRMGTPASFEEGAMLFLPHQKVEHLSLILEGEAELEEVGSGSRSTIRRTGDCFGESAFVSDRPAGMFGRAKSKLEIVQLNRHQVGSLLRSHPVFAESLSRMLSAAAPSGGRPPARTGDIAAHPLAETVQRLHLSRATGHLRILKTSVGGGIAFVDGEIRHAWLGPASGETAYFQLMGWTEGTFAFDDGQTLNKKTVESPTLGLLLEAVRRP